MPALRCAMRLLRFFDIEVFGHNFDIDLFLLAVDSIVTSAVASVFFFIFFLISFENPGKVFLGKMLFENVSSLGYLDAISCDN